MRGVLLGTGQPPKRPNQELESSSCLQFEPKLSVCFE